MIMHILPIIGSSGLIKLKNKSNFFLLNFYIFLLIVFIGLRHEVGGDWVQYYHNYYNHTNFDIFKLDIRSDYLYNFICFIFYNFGLSFHYVNLILSIFFVISIINLLRFNLQFH